MDEVNVKAAPRCPSTNDGARCRLRFGHKGDHQGNKADLRWSREPEPSRNGREAGEHLR